MAVTPQHRPQQGRRAPAPGLLRRLDDLARLAFPGASTAVLKVLAAAPVSLPSPVFAVTLPCVAFWSVFRPASMSPPVTFLLGVLLDLLTLSPLGAGVLVLLVLHAVSVRFRRFLARQSFLAVWLAFCVGAAGAAGSTGCCRRCWRCGCAGGAAMHAALLFGRAVSPALP